MCHLRVGRQADANDLAGLAEKLADGVLVNAEGQVTNKQGIALRADAIAMLLGTILSTSLGSRVGGTGIGVVEVEGTAVKV